MERGVIDKNSIGAEKSDSLYHRIVKDYGTEAARQFLNSITRLLTSFISSKGFTYSLDELDLSEQAQRKIDSAIDMREKNVRELIDSYHKETLPRLPGQTLEESLEIYIMNELAKARDEAGNIADEYFGMDNDGIIMTRSGARGSSLNIGQMTACLGQQAVRGKRIFRGYRNRAMSHFKEGDQSPSARGFVGSNYRDGLSPLEFFFHAMGGREGLVDTAVRTQTSGYMQRRLINALEYLKIEHDGTVRDSVGDIVEFRYGEDGIDPAKSDHGKAVNIERLVERLSIGFAEGKAATKQYTEGILEKAEDSLTPLLVKEIREQAQKAKLTPEAVDKLVQIASENYRGALVEPGEAVGIIAAQSIGEPGTQMTLRTFHYAGVKEQNVTLGLPRLIEIVDARRKPSTPIMTIYLDEEHRSSREDATSIAQQLVFTTMEDIAAVAIDPLRGAIVARLSTEKMKNRGITRDDLVGKFQIPSTTTESKDDLIFITPKDPKNLQKVFDKTTSLQVKGISGIRRALVSDTGKEWVISTDGSNLPKVMRIPGIDLNRTTTNNIHEIAETLGIEAARNKLIQEAQGVLDEQGLDVDIRHVMLVADIMTMTGDVFQIGRHGVSGKKSSVIARAAFEITVPTLVDAASKGTVDMFRGVTESVIVGQSIPVGTGIIEIYMRMGKGEVISPKETSNQ